MLTHSAEMSDTRYASLGEFMAAASLAPRNARNKEFTDSADNGDHWGDDWTGGASSTAKAVEAMSGQYSKGATIIKRIETASAKIKLPPKMDLRRRRVTGDQGDDLDITAVYAGRLDIAWTRTQRRPQVASPMVSIVVNTILQGGADASVVSFRGAVGIVLAQLLERFGYRVRIVFAMGGTICGNDEKFSVRATIKDYGKPVDRETISCATHPALFRVIGHRWMWAHSRKVASHGGARVQEAVKEANEIYVSHDVSNERSAVAFLKATIEQLTK